MEYKKTLRYIIAIFVVVLVLATFFSQTLADLNIPVVSLGFAQQGVILSAENVASNQPNVIPLSAVRQDMGGYFILYIEAVPRRFGTSYYARRHAIEVRRRDILNASVGSQIPREPFPSTPVIINSDVMVFEGDRVRLAAGSTFTTTR